jgi:methionyl-tRNA synthetase
MLKPVLPRLATQAETFLGTPVAQWCDLQSPLLGSRIQAYRPLFTRIDPQHIEAMIEASKESLQPAPEATTVTGTTTTAKATGAASPDAKPTTAASAAEPAATISIDDFAKLDLRVGTVLACDFVEGSDKLLRFQLDAGALGQRQIFSGIRASYGAPGALVGRRVVFIANLAPRKMRFGISEGMILSAGGDGAGLYLLDADDGALPGMPVK